MHARRRTIRCRHTRLLCFTLVCHFCPFRVQPVIDNSFIRNRVNWENNLVKVEIASAYSLSSNASIDSTKSNTTGADDVIGHERASKIHIYCGIVAIVLYLVLQRLFGFVYLCSQASYRLHAGLMRGIMGTTMRFFRVNDSGRILNRFSKDMSIIDSSVPSAVYYTTSVSMVMRARDHTELMLPLKYIFSVFAAIDFYTSTDIFRSCFAHLAGVRVDGHFLWIATRVREHGALYETHRSHW